MTKILAVALFGTLLAGGAYAAPQDASRPDPLALADANKDGTLTKAEFTADADARFTQLDVNKDGKLAKSEFPARGGRMLERSDADSDGTVSLAEYRAGATRRFDRFDANADGKIDQAERTAMRERMRGMMNRRGGE